MEQTKYRIGDVADLIGMSRDTLRHYEKEGILSSRRGDNGYRYYTDRDLARLITILYQRKMNFGLDDIGTLSGGHCDEQQMVRILKERLAKEEADIRRHRQNIARIRITCEDFENIERHRGEVFATQLPASYVIVSHTDFDEGIPLWFRYAAKYPGLDMMYVLDEYSWDEYGTALHMAWHNTRLILKEEVRDLVDYPVTDETPTLETPPLCLSAFLRSETRTPSEEQIRPLLQAACEQDLLASRRLYCTFTSQDINRDVPLYYLQIYLPVF